MRGLACIEAGTGPVVVLLHGFPLDHSIWDEQWAALDRAYHVLAPDLRGHGGSALGDGPWTIETMADDVAALLDAKGIVGPVAVAGHSMGGYIALAFAARHRHRLGALALVASRAAADPPAAARGREELAARVEDEGTPDAVVEAFLPRLFGRHMTSRRSRLVPRIRRIMEGTPVPTLAACLRAMATRPDRTGELAGLDVPALVLAGGDDPIATPAEGRTIAESLPRGTLAVVPDAGHLLMVEDPEATTHALRGWLDRAHA